MSDYVLENVKWGSSTFGTGGGTVTYAFDGSMPDALRASVNAAFKTWSSEANISFTQVASTSGANITFSESYLDGADNELGVTSYYYSGSNLKSAQVTFDSSENWHQSGTSVVSSDNLKFYLVALHEIGHAIGLDHYNASPAVMNAYLDNSLIGLTQSDIDGVEAIYGAAPVVAANEGHFGSLTYNDGNAGGRVYSLYQTVFGRAADRLGLESYAAGLSSGGSVHDLAQNLLVSAEGQSHLGQSDNKAFVDALYQTALGRNADASGEQNWVSHLAQGMSRADVVTSFAFSQEKQNDLSGSFSAGIFVADQASSEAARLYYGLLDRAPDADGLDHYTAALKSGASLHDVAQGFLGSGEFQALGTGNSDTNFVQGLYQAALGRSADAGGLQSYVGNLQHGSSRADVALSITQSTEAQQHLAANIEFGWKLS